MDITIRKINESYVKIDCDRGIAYELNEYFSFRPPGYQFMPSFKNKMWDGYLRLFNIRNSTLYYGLVSYVKTFCDERGYSVDIKDDIIVGDELSVVEAKDFISHLKLPFKERDYQLKTLIHAIRNKRTLVLSPTGSGKSLSIYLIVRYLQMRGLRGLLIVPTVSLVTQMYKDFEHYGYNSEKYCHMIYSGKEKDTDKFLTISTWQSLYKMPKKFFEKFDFVIGDECHLFKAKSLTTIMDSCINASYRIGTTGTLDGTQVHKLVLEGIFGPIMKATTTSELIDKGQLSKFSVKCLILKYPDEVCKNLKGSTYQEEMDFIVRNDARNNFIKNLTLSLERNTLVLFQYVEKHGKILYDMLKGCGKEVFFIHGGTDIETRENVREITEKFNKTNIILSFDDKKVILNSEDDVYLKNNSIKKAKDITMEDDIDDNWIRINSYK